MILVGNKADLVEDRVVSKVEGRDLAKRWGIPFMETSAKNRVRLLRGQSLCDLNVVSINL